MTDSQQIPEPGELITVQDAAREFEMGESTAWLLIKRHELDRYRMPGMGKKTFIRREDFERAYRTPVLVKADAKKAAA